LEFNVAMFKALKSLENDHTYGKKILENCNSVLENADVCYTVEYPYIFGLAVHDTKHLKLKV